MHRHGQAGALDPPAHRRTAAEDPFQAVRRPLEDRPEDDSDGPGGRFHPRLGELGQAPQVEEHPLLEVGAPQDGQSGHGQPEPEPSQGAERPTDDGGSHDITRRSMGNRPIRIMVRYATRQRPAPTPRTTTPAVDA